MLHTQNSFSSSRRQFSCPFFLASPEVALSATIEIASADAERAERLC